MVGSSSYGSNATLSCREILQTPISFRSSTLAGSSSSVLTSILCFNLVRFIPVTCVLDLNKYWRPGIIADSCIHRTRAWNWSANEHGCSAVVMISPRETSTSSASVIVIDLPAPASDKSPPHVTILSIVDSVPLGSILTLSPGETVPLATKPENPRKSRFGLLTHCTGIRNGRI